MSENQIVIIYDLVESRSRSGICNKSACIARNTFMYEISSFTSALLNAESVGSGRANWRWRQAGTSGACLAS